MDAGVICRRQNLQNEDAVHAVENGHANVIQELVQPKNSQVDGKPGQVQFHEIPEKPNP